MRIPRICDGAIPRGETASHETPPSAVEESPRAVATQPSACASSPLAGRAVSSWSLTASAAIEPSVAVRGETRTTVDLPPVSENVPRYRQPVPLRWSTRTHCVPADVSIPTGTELLRVEAAGHQAYSA